MKKLVLISLLVTGGWVAGCGCDDSNLDAPVLDCPVGYRRWNKDEGSKQKVLSDDNQALLTFELPASDIPGLQICLGGEKAYEFEIMVMGNYHKVINPQLNFYLPMSDLEVVIPDLNGLWTHGTEDRKAEAKVKKILKDWTKYFFVSVAPGSERKYDDVEWTKQGQDSDDSYWGMSRNADKVGTYGFEIVEPKTTPASF